MALATETPEQTWPPPEGGCPAWCETTGTHQPEKFPEDRVHFGPEHQVALSLEPGVDVGDGEVRSEYLTVYLRQVHQERPGINLSKGDDIGVTLTFEEVRELVTALWSAVLDSATVTA